MDMNNDEEDDIWDAVMNFRKDHPWCDLCEKSAKEGCPYPKNGYCEQFRHQAEIDAKQVNMHQPINKYHEK